VRVLSALAETTGFHESAAPMIVSSPSRRAAKIAAVAFAVLALAACGRRGALEAPPGLTASPKPVASERLVAPVAQVTTTDSGAFDPNPDYQINDPRAGQQPVAVAPAPVDPNKPKKRFILDKLVE